MKYFNFILVLTFSVCSISEDGRLGREANDYKYTSIGIDIVQTDQTGIGAKLSFVLPGPLYAFWKEEQKELIKIQNHMIV